MTVSTSSQSSHTVSYTNAHSLNAAIFKILALKIGYEINESTIAPSTHRASFNIMYDIFLLYSKKTSHSNNITDFIYRDLPLQFAK